MLVHDPIAEAENVYREFGIELVREEDLRDLDCIVIAVPHNVFLEKYDLDTFNEWYKDENKKVLIDIKSKYDRKASEEKGYHYWSL